MKKSFKILNQEYEKYLNYQSNHKNNVHRSVKRYSNKKMKTQIKARLVKSFGTKINSVLAIGCRSSDEINFLENSLNCKATGLDLFSLDKRIVKGDMHNCAEIFKDKEFEICYSCHSLEHSQDPERLLLSLKKIVKKGIFFIVPPTGNETSPTRGHPFWVESFSSKKFNIENIQNLINELVGGKYGTVKDCFILDDSNYCFSIDFGTA